jgi:hypothetical protein
MQSPRKIDDGRRQCRPTEAVSKVGGTYLIVAGTPDGTAPPKKARSAFACQLPEGPGGPICLTAPILLDPGKTGSRRTNDMEVFEHSSYIMFAIQQTAIGRATAPYI